MSLFLSALRLAFTSILRNRTRAALTMLGILIGVAAVVTVTALTTGATSQITSQIDSLGSNVMFIFPQTTQASGARNKVQGRLTEGDARALLRDSVSLSDTAPYLEAVGQVVAAEKNASTQIIGTTRSYFPMRKFTIHRGDLWSESDELLKNKVCVVGEVIAEKLFAGQDPIGKVIRIGKAPFTILGTLEKRGSSAFGEDEDDRVMMPIGSFRARVRPTSPGRADMIVAAATSEDTVTRAQTQVEGILRQRHRIAEGRDADFMVRTQAEFQETRRGITSALTALLLSVAAVSLLVGGIGVMNIMLVSVAERTREIGIRMSIGARATDILVQFLVEAITLSILGGLLGILAGTAATLGLGHALDWPLAPSPAAIAVAAGTSATIGILFGFLPARRASQLEPIVALRSD